jgi:hypothetical protein
LLKPTAHHNYLQLKDARNSSALRSSRVRRIRRGPGVQTAYTSTRGPGPEVFYLIQFMVLGHASSLPVLELGRTSPLPTLAGALGPPSPPPSSQKNSSHRARDSDEHGPLHRLRLRLAACGLRAAPTSSPPPSPSALDAPPPPRRARSPLEAPLHPRAAPPGSDGRARAPASAAPSVARPVAAAPSVARPVAAAPARAV